MLFGKEGKEGHWCQKPFEPWGPSPAYCRSNQTPKTPKAPWPVAAYWQLPSRGGSWHNADSGVVTRMP